MFCLFLFYVHKYTCKLNKLFVFCKIKRWLILKALKQWFKDENLKDYQHMFFNRSRCITQINSYKQLYTRVPFIKQPTCLKQPYRMFPNFNFVLIFTSAKQPQPRDLSNTFLCFHWVAAQGWLYNSGTVYQHRFDCTIVAQCTNTGLTVQ